MQRRLILASPLILMGSPTFAGTLVLLVTPDEMARERAHVPPMATSALLAPPAGGVGTQAAPHTRSMGESDGPRILVDAPTASGSLQPPLSFRLRFMAQPGATIDTASFRATYGFLGVNITDRLLTRAKLSAQGLIAEGLDIPTGSHEVTLAITDSMGRQGSQSFGFTVG